MFRKGCDAAQSRLLRRTWISRRFRARSVTGKCAHKHLTNFCIFRITMPVTAPTFRPPSAKWLWRTPSLSWRTTNQLAAAPQLGEVHCRRNEQSKGVHQEWCRSGEVSGIPVFSLSDSQAFVKYLSHQPRGVINPATLLQACGGENSVQLPQCSIPRGVV